MSINDRLAALAELAHRIAPVDDALHDAIADTAEELHDAIVDDLEELAVARRAIALLTSMDATTRASVRAHAEGVAKRATQERRSCGDYRDSDGCDRAETKERAATMLIAAVTRSSE